MASKKTDKPILFECVRCGLKADSVSKIQTHVERKTPCKVSDTGINIDLSKYKTEILNGEFKSMLRCIFCNEYFKDGDLFIKHKLTCDKETIKKIPADDTGKNYCERCHKAFKFKDSDHTIVCNDTLEEYKKIEEEKNNLEDEVRDLRMLNRKLNEELFKFANIVNKCIDDYAKYTEVNEVNEVEKTETEKEN